jgi:hypothetical protein
MYKQLVIIGDEDVIPFHDREIVLYGTEWLRQLLAQQPDPQFCFVRDLGENFQ